MCGLAGIFNHQNQAPVNGQILVKMRDTMKHRGPDGAGVWISQDRNCGLAHRRLSIIDLSEKAAQPMSNEAGTLWIVFNGEIYNHAEIRPELEKAGHQFRTDHSDTEVIIHSFEEWGPDCVKKFRGMFAFALYNDIKKELWLFRDRLGIKPLYYTTQSGKLLFASEIKAILAYPGVKREIDEKSLYHYLSFLITPPPHTLFKGIMKLPAGCYLRTKPQGSLQIKRYWELWDNVAPLKNVPEEEIASLLLKELETAVKYRKVSDVPVGVFLSGGLDSSTNAVLFSKEETSPIKTFSIGYDKEYPSYSNEFFYAKKIAQIVKSDHYERKISLNDLIGFLPKLIYHQDEPIGDPVCVPVYYVSKLARDNKVIVCQVGEGSDELFWGYSKWKRALKLQKISNLPLTSISKKMGLWLLKMAGKEQKVYYEWLKRASEKRPIFWGGASAFTDEEKKKLLPNKLFEGFDSFSALQPILDRFQEKAWERSPLQWMSYVDLNLRLPELLLMRVDKMSMAVSLETRVPFLDHKFVELAMSIPEKIKTKNGTLKYILKRAVKGVIPDEIVNREKQGFNLPLYEWFFEKQMAGFSRKKLVQFAQKTNIFNRSYVEGLIENNETVRLWCLLNFVLWYEYWIEKTQPL